MDNSREIAGLRRRANKVAVLASPPELTIAVWREGQEPPEEKPWQLKVMIEQFRRN